MNAPKAKQDEVDSQKNNPEDNTLTIVTYNISQEDANLDTTLEPALVNEPRPDIICLQETNEPSFAGRKSKMDGYGYVLLGATKDDRKDICLETYILKSKKNLLLNPNEWKCSSCTHEITYDPDDLESRRNMALACSLEFQNSKIWIVNLHFPFSPRKTAYKESNDWHWKYSLPEFGDMYANKNVIFAGDWNFDAPAAFDGLDVVENPSTGSKFTRTHPMPIISSGLKFPDCSVVSDIEKPTYNFKGNGVRVDAIAYRHAPTHGPTAPALEFRSYKVYGDITKIGDGKHLPVIAKFSY